MRVGPEAPPPAEGAAAPARRRGFFALWLPPVLYLGAIFWISSQSHPLVAPPDWLGSDKVAHFLAYAGLGFLLCRAYLGSGLGASAAVALAILTASLYGASDEWHQSFVPNRSADARDWLADSAGAALGAFLLLRFLRHRRSGASIR